MLGKKYPTANITSETMSDHGIMQRIDRFDESLNELSQDIKYIRTALTGDDSIGMTGIVAKQVDVEARLQALERFKQRLSGYIVGAAIGGGATAAGAVKWLLG